MQRKVVSLQRRKLILPWCPQLDGLTRSEALMSCCRCNAALGGHMSSYRTVVVGTDGSDSSMRAVDRAGAIAARENVKLIIATAQLPGDDKGAGKSTIARSCD
jgi:hypothetical protein